MLFITEDRLREEYKKSPFDSYLLKKKTKLTPQARQFLIDFRIKIVDENKKNPIKKRNEVEIKENASKDKTNVKKALIIKELAHDMREFDNDLALKLNKLAIDLYKEKGIYLENKDVDKDKAIEIYINLNLISPYLRAFTEINKAVDKIRQIDENLGALLLENLYAWFIKISKGGESN